MNDLHGCIVHGVLAPGRVVLVEYKIRCWQQQVAADGGYASPGAFGRMFLQRVGATPTHWQRGEAAGI